MKNSLGYEMKAVTAEEAYQKARVANLVVETSQYQIIRKNILAASDNGKYHICINFYIKPEVKSELEKDGFKVGESISQYNESSVRIAWDHLGKKK